MPTRDPDREFAKALARAADDHKAEDVVVLDLRGISQVTDYFVIVTGFNRRHLAALREAFVEVQHIEGRNRFGTEGHDDARWVLLDFGSIVAHAFDKESRDFYDLELLWGDARKVTWRVRASKAKPKPKLKAATGT